MGPAIEESTYIINCAFLDEDGDAVVPQTLTWTLTDMAGNVINSREDVSVSSPTSSEDIVLSGDDLATSNTPCENTRIFTAEATYDSDLGNGLPLKKTVIFTIQNLVTVT